MNTKKDMMIVSSNNSLHYLKSRENKQTLVKCGTVIYHGADQSHISPLKTNCAIEKNWEPQNKLVLLLFKIIVLN